MLDIDQIQQRLPHRFPFLMVDRVLELEEGKRAVTLKNVTINEPFFQGHYPQTPVMPGVLMIEAMAQTGGLAAGGAEEDTLPLFAAIDKARFRRIVKPGDQLIITAEIIAKRRQLVKVTARAEVEGNVAAEGELTFVLTERGAAIGNDTSKNNARR